MLELGRSSLPAKVGGILDWVDDRFGPLRALSFRQMRPPAPAWWLFTFDLARPPVCMWFQPFPSPAGGTSTDRTEALLRALGEAVERYSALNAVNADEAVHLPYRENGLADRFPSCSPDEPCAPSFRGLDLDVPLTHVPVRHLATDRRHLIPALYVHLNFWPAPPEPLVTYPISTGLAFHSDLHQAIWRGLCEVAERDALMLAWWTRSPVSAIDSADPQLPFAVADRLERLHHVGLHALLFDATTDFRVPTVICLVSRQQYPCYVFGSGCQTDPAGAAAKAIDEAVSIWLLMNGIGPWEGLPSHERFDWVRRLEDHPLLYANWPAAPALDFLLSQCRQPISFREFAERSWWPQPGDLSELRGRAARLDAAGLTVLWTELTAPEAADFGHVVRVVVPEMVPMSVDHSVRWLGTPRLLQAAGVTRSCATSFNPYPHPFA